MGADRDDASPAAGSERTAEPWLGGRPDEILIGTAILLERWSDADVDELVEAVNDTLTDLRLWMPWAQEPVTAEGMAFVVREAHAAWDAGREFAYVIRDPGERSRIVGCCGLHDRIGTGSLEIGYWVRSGHGGRGVATEAAGLLTRSALAIEGVHRVEIHCDEANVRSAAIPPKLGFALDRVERRPPQTPGETERHMIWVTARDRTE